MKRISSTSSWCLLAVAVGAAPTFAQMPRYVAVELNGAAAPNEPAGRGGTATGGRRAFALRDNPEVEVGSAGIGSRTHAMIWMSAAHSAVDLHSYLPGGYTDSVATGIDEEGNVTGMAIDMSGAAHDFLWRAGSLASGGSGGGSGGGGGGTGGGGGGGVTTDKISITRALWFWNLMALPTGELLVQATSSSPDAVLTLSDTSTGRVISILPNIGGGKYGGTVIFQNDRVGGVTVTSSLGGTASRSVILGVQ